MSWIIVGTTLAGGAMGLANNNRAKQVEDSDRKLAAATQRYSPWTGLQAQPIRSAGSMFGDIGGGALSGFGVGQSAHGLFNKPTSMGNGEVAYLDEEQPWWGSVRK